MMNAVSLPTLLTLNDSEYAFTIKDMDSDAETKSVYLIRKGFPKDKLLFSIKDIDDKQFEISSEQGENTFSYDKAHELSNFFVEILKKNLVMLGQGK